MVFTPLLPKSKGQDWPTQTGEGLHPITEIDYQSNLCENYYEASDFGTPSPLAQAVIFEQRLGIFLTGLRNSETPSFAETFELWSLLAKGVYLGVLSLRPVGLESLGDLGAIVARELPEDFDFQFICFEGRVVGFTHPGVGFCSSVRLDPELQQAIEASVEERSVDKAPDYFVGWIREAFGALATDEIPFYALLEELGRRWRPDGPTELPMEVERLFDKGPQLSLTAPDGAGEAVARPHLRLYKGTPIVCGSCQHEISSDGSTLEIRTPQDCRCSNCGKPHNVLEPFERWVRFDERRSSYLIYAFEGSDLRKAPMSDSIRFDADGIRRVTGRFTLKIFGLVLREETLRCEALTFFKDGDRIQRPSLPVRGEFFGLVELIEGSDHGSATEGRDYRAQLKVEGWPETVTLQYRADEIQYEEALLLSWPNFSLKGWRAHYYLIETTTELNMRGLRLRGLTSDARPQLLGETRGQTEHPFEAFEVVFTQKEQGERKVEQHAGIFKHQRRKLQRGQSPITLALDFGTTNSALWYRVANGAPEVLRFRDFTAELVMNRSLAQVALEQSTWLPTYRIDDPDTAREIYAAQLESIESAPSGQDIVDRMNTFIPSELIVNLPVSAESLSHPVSGFRICHAYGRRPSGEIQHEIKTLETSGDPAGRYKYEQIVTRYLEQFLVLALASILNEQDQAGNLDVRVSFPRAFEPEKVERYLETVESIFGRLHALTGFSTNSQRYLDESRAAAYSMATPSGLSLVMDMGGGTTDIGVFETRKGEPEALFIDSFHYGGNDFLNLLVAESELFPKPTEPVDPKEHRLLWLLREIRMRGFQSLVNTYYHGADGRRTAALDLLLRFYAPVAYYAGRLFSALGARHADRNFLAEPVTCFLVGNGWTLGDSIPLPEAQPGSHGYKAVVRYLLGKQGFTQVSMAGEASFGPGDPTKWPGPKSAVGYGLLKAPENKLHQNISAASETTGVNAILGFDQLAFKDGSHTAGPYSWQHPVPLDLPSPNHLPDFSQLELPEDWDFIDLDSNNVRAALTDACAAEIRGVEHPRLMRSPLTRFIETVYRSQLPMARRL